ncbi:MAG: protein kinase domain-containing protein [Nitrososphaerota archaeon]
MADLVGKTIGNYKIEALLGTGGMGQVYRGVHQFLKVERAVKVMNPGVASDTSFQARFQQEAQAAAALNHQNIVQVFDFGEEKDQFYMVMELVIDGSLRSLLRQRASGQTWELPLGLDLIRQAAEGLGYAHSKGMVHRDIKPDNLLLQKLSDTPSGKPQYLLKITDFGLARLAEGGGVRTVSGMVMGTPAYMSPEQCQGGAVDGRSDLYSLGVVLYEVATGYLPFQASSVSEAIYKHVFVAPPPPRQVRPDLPQALEDIILRCLVKKPEGRYATGEELARALQGVSGRPELTTMQPIRPGQPKASPTPATPPAPATALESPNAGGTPPPAVPPLAGYSSYPRIRVMDESGRTLQVVEVNKPVLIVGRQPGSDVLLAEEGVSRQHLRIAMDGARVSVTDLGSNNGTLLAGSRLLPQATTDWEKGQALRIGPYWLSLEAPTAAAPAGPSQLSGVPGNFHVAPTIPGSTGAPAPYASPAVAAPTQESGRIRVSVEQEALTLTPGQPAVVKVTLANTGTTVDHLTLVVEGVSQSWIQGPNREVQLNPGQQETTTLTVQAPRLSTSRAGMYPVVLRANSRENPGDSGSTFARWTVTPFAAESLTLRPERVRARRTAHYNMVLQNNGNAPVQYTFVGEDPEAKLQYEFARMTVPVDPGKSQPVPLTVRAPWKLSGLPEMRDFRVSARPSTGSAPQVAGGQLMHASLLPGWLPPPVLALLVVGVVALASLFGTGVLPGALANIGAASPTATTSTGGGNTGNTGGSATATAAPTPTIAPTPTQPILSTSSATVTANNCFDLDNGTLVTAGTTEADFCWQVADPTRTLAPQNNATASIQSAGAQPGYQECLNANLRSDPINGSPSGNEIPSGTYLCFRTSDNRVAMVHIDMYGTDLQIDYTTWK